ncbi:hypothetical protein GM658_14255 [Pseudoduganella eburnea]|uniref:Uncharacterized protein n=1 Tax=Massilia eburnea TaxID=1776165 RepID=A0A6L6QHS0_9BURK|nr:hypothetical protein [Massilia eburnea]MTW11765.1 hypothetical protein [Massilia eburnea]
MSNLPVNRMATALRASAAGYQHVDHRFEHDARFDSYARHLGRWQICQCG